ncbi:MAG TPA: DUF6538 domain-containing protein [Bosea sp. (in: a-proteobacteria)]|nr:DUF6538 domain-containing protein [Bosea sp. (in: a-proteobacteria)]
MADDDMPVTSHLTTRNGLCQYVRRVPEDLRDAFPFARIQRSLRTRDHRIARQAALVLDQEWDRRFAEARQQRGLASDAEGPAALDTGSWSWEEWQALAGWFGATLQEEDWRARLREAPGAVLAVTPDLDALPRRSNRDVKEHIAREASLRATTVAAYAVERMSFVQGYVRRLGVSLSRTLPYHERFMAACLAAELAYLDLFRQRETRTGGIGLPHPDTLPGPWRRIDAPVAATATAPTLPSLAPALSAQTIGKSLTDCAMKWQENRRLVKKQVRPEYLREMDTTIADFTAHAKIRDIGEIGRRHVLAYRDHLGSKGDYAIQTINKKVGFISSLMATALNAGWTETALGGEIFLEIPEDEDHREPYSAAELELIFGHPIFTTDFRFHKVKACAELQFWLPLIACLHGMISSEIIQLGPDTVLPHPDAPDILCFVVTKAGDRRVKTLARRRWVPIRKELLDLGLNDLVDRARAADRPFLWSAMAAHDDNVTRVSSYFSSFWASFSRKDLKIEAEGTTLYSFRHAFQDEISRIGHGDEIKKALMGHAESGMTGRYGTKRRPRVVNIQELNEAVQGAVWPFLTKIRNDAG